MYKGPAKGIGQLAEKYAVSVKLLKIWLAEAGIEIGNRRILKPKEISILYKAQGEPE